jgi:hypothetical protein
LVLISKETTSKTKGLLIQAFQIMDEVVQTYVKEYNEGRKYE